MKFVLPEMEISHFSTTDVIAASQETEWEEDIWVGIPCDCPAELPMD